MRHMIELALIGAIPEGLLKDLPNSRKKGLLSELQKAVYKDLSRMQAPSRSDLERIEAIVEDFGRSTGWLGQERHVGTCLSFCAAMIEDSEFKHNPKILRTINLLVEHLENGNDFPFQSNWAGSIAADKWAKALEGI